MLLNKDRAYEVMDKHGRHLTRLCMMIATAAYLMLTRAWKGIFRQRAAWHCQSKPA